jgi:hypothetical protein
MEKFKDADMIAFSRIKKKILDIWLIQAAMLHQLLQQIQPTSFTNIA